MTPDPARDPLVRQLAALQPGVPDPIRSARTRGRCRAALVRQHGASERSVTVGVRWRLMESTLLAAGCLAYLSDIARRAFTLHRPF